MAQEKIQTPAADSTKPEVKLQAVDSPGGVYHAYVNHIVIAYTNHDIMLRLGFLSRCQEFLPSDEPTLRLENRATIAMAWSEAKALRERASTMGRARDA